MTDAAMFHIILETCNSVETRTIRTASMLLDHLQISDATIETLPQHARKLADGAMPVGSFGFVREAMHIGGLVEPVNLSYPDSAKPFLHRMVRQCNAGEVIGRVFVKPVATKLFTGFVFDTMQEREAYSAHDQEQYDGFMELAAGEKVFISEPVEWLSEWRFYVAKGQIIGQARYDQNESEDAPVPKFETVKSCIQALAFEHPYAVDFGVLSSGETALVEVNDAWAIGLYGSALPPRTYLAFLQERWAGIYRGSR